MSNGFDAGRERARKRVDKQLGSAFAEKSTDAFNMRYAGGAVPGVEKFDNVIRPAVAGIIVEFRPDPGMSEIRNQLLEQQRASQLIREAYAEMANVAREHAVPVPVPPQRDRIVQLTRDAFLHEVQGLRADVERRIQQPAFESATPMPVDNVQLCWLNRTMLVRGSPEALTEIAGDPRVQWIDVPRPVEAELDVTAHTVNAIGYRRTNNLSGAGQIVAVLDSEIYADHPAFAGCVVLKENYTSESWGNPDAHGTAVAAIVGSRDAVYSGMAPAVTIYNYKILATNPELNANDFGATRALQQAVEDGVHVANCSWGVGLFGPQKSREARACEEAWGLGMIVVKSAGNRGPQPGTLTSPADADDIIVVGATDVAGTTVPDYSSRGDHRRHPDMVAPGGERPRGINSAQLDGGFGDCGVGTSYAAPHVSGLCALLLEQRPGAEPDDVKRTLIANCRALAGFGAEAQGAGLIRLP